MRIGQTAVVTFGSRVLSSVVGFVATVYLARVLGAEVLGTYFLVVAVVIWLQVVSVMGVESALTKRLSERGGDDAHFAAGLVVLAGFLAVVSLLVVALRGPLAAYFGAPVVRYVVPLLLAGVAFRYVAAALRGQHRVHLAALLDPLNRTVRSILQVGAAVAGLGLAGILVGQAAAAVLAAAIGLYYVPVALRRPTRSHLSGIVSYARYSWLGQIGSRAFSSMDTVVLGLFVASGFVGYYEIAWNLASILAVFGTAISQTTFPEMSEVASEGDYGQVRGLLHDAVAYSGLLLVPGLVGSAVVGDLVLRVYGPGFDRAHGVLVVLVGARLVYAYGNQFVNALNGLDRPEIAFRVNLAFVATNLVLNVALVWRFGWVGAAVATATSALATLLLGYRELSRLVAVPVPTGEIARQWLAAAVMGAVVLAGRTVLDATTAVGVALVGLGALVYVAALAALSTEFRATVRRNLAFLGG